MEYATSSKKVKSTVFDNINTKTSITCSNVPESLFETTTAKKHFSKFGRVQKIKFFPKRQMCIVEYDQVMGVEQALLNAGAFDGFMFDVVRTNARIRRKSKKDDDPDWLPDPVVEEELSAMRGGPTYRIARQKAMEIDPDAKNFKVPLPRVTKQPVRKAIPISKVKPTLNAPSSATESSAIITVASTSMSTSEAAAELHQLRSRISSTPDEQWRTLDARDRILRAWGGAGSRVKEGGATIGTCPDMCPEKELLHRQAEHQVMTLETVPDSDGQLEPWRAVKQYSRSSADQEIPMCYELRPAHVLTKTCSYLLNEIADTNRQVTLADWFHFMWDRFRGIRKDITQQALCCADSIRLVEACARFHAHCAARLADLEHTQFDQKLNTDNLTKCLQTLKHMYADAGPELKPREAEFRGYIALLNLGDCNFLWEIKQLPLEIQKSASIVFAIQIFTAIDNNNYVRFFRLVKEKATYLQACILLRYFNDVRARGLARIVKAYAPRGGSRYPAEDIMNALAFESVESMKSFINHYGLRLSKIDSELSVILDRNQFIEDSDPYPLSRSVKLIESKRQGSVGEVIAGGAVPKHDYHNHVLHSSFNKDGKLKETALVAEDLGYNTLNDSNKDIKMLKMEIQKLVTGSRIPGNKEIRKDVTKKITADLVAEAPNRSFFASHIKDKAISKRFSFQPAVPVASSEVLKNTLINETKKLFKFSNPQQENIDFNVTKCLSSSENIAAPGSMFKEPKNILFKNTFGGKSFMSSENKNIFSTGEANKNLFMSNEKNIFNEKDRGYKESHRIFNGANKFSKIFNSVTGPVNNSKSSSTGNIFAKESSVQLKEVHNSANIFKSFTKPQSGKSIFATSEKPDVQKASPNAPIFSANTNSKVSPTSLFKNACQSEKMFSYFPNKNKEMSVADNIFHSVQKPKDIYEFQEDNNSIKLMSEMEAVEAKRKLEEEKRKQEENKLKMQLEEARRKEELKQIEKQRLEEIRKKNEERKQEEIRMKKLEEERMLRRKAEEEKIFKEKVEKDTQTLLADIIEEVNNKTVKIFIKHELDNLQQLLLYSQAISVELLTELTHEVIVAEIKTDTFRRQKLMKKWFYIWKRQYLRNKKRRSLLEDTPIWLTKYTPIEEARVLRRVVEIPTLKNMNAIHKGYKFTGELNQTPLPEPYDVMGIIKSSLLKRMRLINYPYDKCFFWKVALVSPGTASWIYKKVNIQNWLLHVLGDKNKADKNEGLIQVGKYSWNHLMDFAISVGLTNRESTSSQNEVMEGANGVMFYMDENITHLLTTIDEIMKCKYPYQIVPIAVIIPNLEQTSIKMIEEHLDILISNNIISCYKIFVIKIQNLNESLNYCTKSAMKWLANKYPKCPPVEIDYLKSICERYLGNEIWHTLRSQTDCRIVSIQKDLNKLINCYNVAVDKLSHVLTNEDVFNYPQFPLEFNQYLDHSSSYPKPYEFIPSCTKQPDNVFEIKKIMQQLKLLTPTSEFQSLDTINMQEQIQSYCNQIGWFEDPQKVACKVVAILPNTFFNLIMPLEFKNFYEQYNLVDFLNIIIYEKINSLQNFNNRFAIYEKASLEEYRNIKWLYDTDIISGMKHKILDHEENLDLFINTKRRKLENSKIEYLSLENRDIITVQDNIAAVEKEITLFNGCMETVNQLEQQLNDETKKSNELENLLRAALNDV